MWRRSAVSRFSSRISLSSSSSSRLIPWSRELCAVNTFPQPPPSSEPTANLAISGAGSDPSRVLTSGAAAATSRIAAAAGLGHHYARCYWELSKARLSMLVVATSGTGYILGTGNAAVDLAGLCYTCAGTMMIAASANSLNQVLCL
ncbi:hypothetical protein HID58_063513 [Brassica napus]|uniref:Heme O synthase n=1 Tax=Brassica napus TaxID=3708 RepID=A0ABQ8A4G7_BRANA|nr:hypothetical protein HID58_063513 [Brassica napus]